MRSCDLTVFWLLSGSSFLFMGFSANENRLIAASCLDLMVNMNDLTIFKDSVKVAVGSKQAEK